MTAGNDRGELVPDASDKRQSFELPDGSSAQAWRRSARQIRAGDYLPEHGASALAASVYDDTSRRHLVALDDGRDLELTRRAKVWLVRDYRGASWLSAASAAYRQDVAAREAMRESGAILAPSSVPGVAGAAVAMNQLEADVFDEHVPAPQWREYVREYAPRREVISA